jgi:Na+/H+ antiporter NhaD/arsenite permease-like protein
MQEVAKLFAGIFLTIIPVIAMLKAGVDGPFGAVVRAVTNADGTPNPAMYFWATGLLSSFLDNAPTYLVFFNTAGGDPGHLMTDMALTLTAISAGAVFMGANTYIGNAPNLMVKAIAEDRGVKDAGLFRLHDLVGLRAGAAAGFDYLDLVPVNHAWLSAAVRHHHP